MSRLRYNNNVAARSESSEVIKSIALRLFAERGVDGVTVREIAATAGQKNHGAVGYYFGTKEALVREIVADGARIIDERRNTLLDRIDADGGPRSVREIVDVIIFPSLEPFNDNGDDCYMRFTVMLNMTHRDLFVSAVDNLWNRGYQRCLSHLRRLMPPMSAAKKNQRLMFLGSYIAMMLAMRQTALSDTTRAHSTWPSEATLRHLAHTASAIIEAPEEDDGAMPTALGVTG